MNRRLLDEHGQVLISALRVASGFRERLVGLLGRAAITSDEALLFPKTTSLHMVGMRFPIAVIWLGPVDAAGFATVLGAELLRPWTGIGVAPTGTDAALEGHPDLLARVSVGARLQIAD